MHFSENLISVLEINKRRDVSGIIRVWHNVHFLLETCDLRQPYNHTTFIRLDVCFHNVPIVKNSKFIDI